MGMEDLVPRTAVGQPFDGLPRLCLAGMTPSHNTGNAKKKFDVVTEEFPGRYATWCVFFKRSNNSPYHTWVENLKTELNAEQRAKYSTRHGWSSPFVWLELQDGTRNVIWPRRFCSMGATGVW